MLTADIRTLTADIDRMRSTMDDVMLIIARLPQ
jgi:hypothetical protein